MLKSLGEKFLGKKIFTVLKVSPDRLLIHYMGRVGVLQTGISDKYHL